jgi:hypothetical protein
MSAETVKLHVEVEISYVDYDYDTGVTVDAWNAMTPDQRSEIKQDAWSVAAQSDNGGIWTITENATGE